MLRRIPGFWSGRRWKQITASAVYLVAAFLKLAGLWSVGLIVLAGVLLVANPTNLRAWFPTLSCGHRGSDLIPRRPRAGQSVTAPHFHRIRARAWRNVK